MQNLENSPSRTVYTGVSVVNGGLALGLPGPESLAEWSWANWFRKHQDANARQWLGQVESYHGEGAAFARSSVVARASLRQSIGEDQVFWLGWFSRHGGSVTLIGDHFKDSWTPCGLLLALWLALMWMLWRHGFYNGRGSMSS